MPIDAQPPLVIWRLVDGKPGHEKQTLGLAQALTRQVPAQTHTLAAETGAAALGHWLTGQFPPGAALPAPDLILGAGHATHLLLLAARRARGGKAIVLMRPSLPLAWFDLCLIPEHDTPPARANVVATRGVLNAVHPGGTHDPGRGLFLVGGPSGHYRWDDHQVAHQVLAVTRAAPEVAWRLTTSRRTPPGFLPALEVERPANLELVPHTATPPGWLEQRLREAASTWVTEDSVSMLYEALTAGTRVGLIQVPEKASARGGTRVGAGVRDLIAAGWVTPYTAWRETRTLPPPPDQFQEAERCARLILARWFPRRD